MKRLGTNPANGERVEKVMASNINISISQDVMKLRDFSQHAYEPWREAVLAAHSDRAATTPVAIADLGNPSESECAKLIKNCRSTNLSLYSTATISQDLAEIRANLKRFSHALGLRIAERHRSAGQDGIVALTVSEAARQRAYIPYSSRAMNWHTDGYYNAPGEQIGAMVLHCARAAEDGGANQFLDHNVAYIRLRDQNPAYATALSQPEAMTIPENREADGSVRPVSVGPVFSIDHGGYLSMRYTARTRSIFWHDDRVTPLAAQALQEMLEQEDPLMLGLKLVPGQGILCNNVLHNRTGFDMGSEEVSARQSQRVMFRIRFHNRVKEG